MKVRYLLLPALFIAGFLTKANSQALHPGMPAPPLEVRAWLKGKPFDHFEKGKIYVVEFWATWCAPCRENIPGLTALAEKYKNEVIVTGISVMERNPDYVKVFVDDMGPKMAYNIAADTPDEKGTQGGSMARNWLTAAGAPGIPYAFIVGRDGRIAYAGATTGLEGKLKEVIYQNTDQH